MYLAFRRSERGNAPNYTAPPAVEASCPLYSGHIEQREGGSGDEVIASAAAFLQSLLAEQPRSPAELRTDRMLPPSDFKAKDDIPHARLSPGARHHNRHFDYLLCHIIFNRSRAVKETNNVEPHPRDKFIVIDCYCIRRCRKWFYHAGKIKTLV